MENGQILSSELGPEEPPAYHWYVQVLYYAWLVSSASLRDSQGAEDVPMLLRADLFAILRTFLEEEAQGVSKMLKGAIRAICAGPQAEYGVCLGF